MGQESGIDSEIIFEVLVDAKDEAPRHRGMSPNTEFEWEHIEPPRKALDAEVRDPDGVWF